MDYRQWVERWTREGQPEACASPDTELVLLSPEHLLATAKANSDF
jgi:hypothetical protein